MTAIFVWIICKDCKVKQPAAGHKGNLLNFDLSYLEVRSHYLEEVWNYKITERLNKTPLS